MTTFFARRGKGNVGEANGGVSDGGKRFRVMWDTASAGQPAPDSTHDRKFWFRNAVCFQRFGEHQRSLKRPRLRRRFQIGPRRSHPPVHVVRSLPPVGGSSSRVRRTSHSNAIGYESVYNTWYHARARSPNTQFLCRLQLNGNMSHAHPQAGC